MKPYDLAFHEMRQGAFVAMLFTSGRYSDNPNAPREFGAENVPDAADYLSAADFAQLSEGVEGFLTGPDILDILVESDQPCEDWGACFHYARNGHGAGFFDRPYPNERALTEWARTFGEFELPSEEENQ